MSQTPRSRCAVLRALACASILSAISSSPSRALVGNDAKSASVGSAQSEIAVRLRSFVAGARAQVVVEPSRAGGRVKLMAAHLPEASSVSPRARAFVVWATGARVVRLGELRRAGDGSGAFEFSRPAGFDAYSIVVTAEQSAGAARPEGAFVFTSRAGEIAALYPPAPPAANVRARTVTKTTNAAADPAATAPDRAPTMTMAAPPATRAAEFYDSVNSAVSDPAAARTLRLEGVDGARRASASARVATRDGTAYVRVRFRRVPAPARFGVRKYVMWAQAPGDGTYFLRALPRRGINRRPTYARRPNFSAPDFNLLVTAERRYPRARPRGRRILKTVRSKQ